MPTTYGQKKVQFLYVQPSPALVEGITTPKIPDAKSITIHEWPETFAEIAPKLAESVT